MASGKMKRHGANANSRRASARGARRSPVSRSRSLSAADGKPRSSRGTPVERQGRKRGGQASRGKTSARAQRVRKTEGFLKRAPRGVLVPLVVAGVLAFSIWSFYPVARVQYREARQKAKLEAEYEALKDRNARLAKQVARLKTPEGVEDAARENLGLVKEGEHAVVVVDPTREITRSAGPIIDSEPTVQAPRGPWTAALDAFFGYSE